MLSLDQRLSSFSRRHGPHLIVVVREEGYHHKRALHLRCIVSMLYIVSAAFMTLAL